MADGGPDRTIGFDLAGGVEGGECLRDLPHKLFWPDADRAMENLAKEETYIATASRMIQALAPCVVRIASPYLSSFFDLVHAAPLVFILSDCGRTLQRRDFLGARRIEPAIGEPGVDDFGEVLACLA